MTYLVAIGGHSAGGKTTLTQGLVQHLQAGDMSTAVLSLDDLYRDDILGRLSNQKRHELCFNPHRNYDLPDFIDWDWAEDLVQDLREGQAINFAKYNMKTHSRDGKAGYVDIEEGYKVVLVEGLYALLRKQGNGCGLSTEFDHKVFVDSPEAYRAMRRIKRDINERGRELNDVIRQLELTVLVAGKKYVDPTRKNANEVIEWHVNPLEEADPERVNNILLDKVHGLASYIYRGAGGTSEQLPRQFMHLLDWD